jgi:hypothetical protein
MKSMKSKAKVRENAKKPHVLGYLLSREELAKVNGGLASVPHLETPGFVSNERLGHDQQG